MSEHRSSNCPLLQRVESAHGTAPRNKTPQSITVSRPRTQASTKLKLLLEQWFIAQLEMFVHTQRSHTSTRTHTCTHAAPWAELCVILGCGRPWLESWRIALCWIHWDHMFKTAWLGPPRLPYKQGNAVSTYQEDERGREGWWGRTTSEERMALARETG